jgi:hypothetical protein
MTHELDHIFVATQSGAPECRFVTAAGFIEGPLHDHPGQGTASRGFFFENAYLELIWLTDAQVAAAEPIRRTGLVRRVDPMSGVSPFGFGLRSTREPVPWARTASWRVPEHPNGVRRITRVSFSCAASPSSRVLSDFLELGLVLRDEGDVPILQIDFDWRRQGQNLDLRPHLPLLLFF